MFKAAIFDLDGTLAYTIGDLRTAMNLMLEKCGYPLRSPEEILAAINCGSREFVRKSLPQEVRGDEERVTECHRIYSGFYNEHFNDTTYLYDGIGETLGVMKRHGFMLAVLSNKQDAHTNAMVNRLLPGVFDIIFGNREGFPTKPDPASALWIAGKLEVKPFEVLYVGDSDVDMQTAKNAGFFAAGVTWGYRSREVLTAAGADALADIPKDLLKLI